MRPVLAFAVLCLSLALVGAGRPAPPRPTPTPSPAPSATPNHMPILVVFPFNISSDLQAGSGEQAAALFVQAINAAGGVDAISAPATIAKTGYQSYARSHKGDYYLAGYMTPLSGGVSLVEQVVSVDTGTIVFGYTAQIETLADATSQAANIRTGILEREQSMASHLSQAPTQATPTPLPGNQANIGHLAGGLFKRRPRATPTPVPTAVVKPQKGVFVVPVGGSEPASALSSATSQLFYAVDHHFIARMGAGTASTAAQRADAICGSNRDNTVATGMLSSKTSKHGFRTETQYAFTLYVYTCFGARLAEAAGQGDSADKAIKAAVDAYAKAHPQNI